MRVQAVSIFRHSKTISTVVVLMITAGLTACASKQPPVEANKATAANTSSPFTPTAKVLARERNTGVVAMDGLTSVMNYIATGVKDEVRRSTVFESGQGLDVQSEGHTEIKLPVDKKSSSPAAWTRNPKDFDFLVNWEINWTEHQKTYVGEPLTLTVKETIQVEKVSDPKVTKTWTYTYDLHDPQSFNYPKITTPEEVALDKTKTVIAPARGPVLNEVRSFILANSK